MDFDVHDLKLYNSDVLTEATSEEIRFAHAMFRDTMAKLPRSFDAVLSAAGNALVTKWHLFGEGAGMIEWVDGRECPAITIVCSGIDPMADKAALDDYAERYRPPQEIIDRIASYSTPFMTTAYYSDRAILTLRICGLAIGFGQAFFERFPAR